MLLGHRVVREMSETGHSFPYLPYTMCGVLKRRGEKDLGFMDVMRTIFVSDMGLGNDAEGGFPLIRISLLLFPEYEKSEHEKEEREETHFPLACVVEHGRFFFVAPPPWSLQISIRTGKPNLGFPSTMTIAGDGNDSIILLKST